MPRGWCPRPHGLISLTSCCEIQGTCRALSSLFSLVVAVFVFRSLTLLLSGVMVSCILPFQGPEEQEQDHEAEKKMGGAGFLWRSFQQAKRLGEAIDPDAMAQVGQAWKVNRRIPATTEK